MAKAKKAKLIPPAGAVEDVPVLAAPAPDQAPAVPRHTAEGVLLNPEDFNVGSDGVLIPKAR